MNDAVGEDCFCGFQKIGQFGVDLGSGAVFRETQNDVEVRLVRVCAEESTAKLKEHKLELEGLKTARQGSEEFIFYFHLNK